MNIKFPGYSLQIATPDQFEHPEDKLAHPNHTWHGAAIMWHESLDQNIASIENVHGRFTAVKLGLEDQNILVISAYLPTSGRDSEYLDCLGDLSTFITENTPHYSTILIGMDSNCSEKSTPRRCSSLAQFCTDHTLVKVMVPCPTFHHSNGTSHSNIDYFLITQSSTTCLRNIFSLCTQEHPQNLSSHDPILASLHLPCSEQANKKEKYVHSYSKFEQTRVIWPEGHCQEYQDLAEKALAEYEQYFPTSEFLPLKCQLYSDLLVKAADLTLKTKPNLPAKKVKSPPQVHHAWKHLHKYYNIWKREGKPRDTTSNSFLEYKQSKSENN